MRSTEDIEQAAWHAVRKFETWIAQPSSVASPGLIFAIDQLENALLALAAQPARSAEQDHQQKEVP